MPAPLVNSKTSARVTGHVSLRKRSRGSVYYLKYRLADGRQVQRLLGPAWTERSRPPAGYYTRTDRGGGTARAARRRSPGNVA